MIGASAVQRELIEKELPDWYVAPYRYILIPLLEPQPTMFIGNCFIVLNYNKLWGDHAWSLCQPFLESHNHGAAWLMLHVRWVSHIVLGGELTLEHHGTIISISDLRRQSSVNPQSSWYFFHHSLAENL